jgi:hypothetical protein
MISPDNRRRPVRPLDTAERLESILNITAESIREALEAEDDAKMCALAKRFAPSREEEQQ